MSIQALIDKHGVLVTKRIEGTVTNTTGFAQRSYSTSGAAFRAFVQPQSAAEPIQAGSDTMFITHKVYAPASQGIESAGRLLTVDADGNLLRLDIIGVHRPGLFRSGNLGHVVIDCQQDTGLDS